MLKCWSLSGTLIVRALLGVVSARADLALTPAGIADGFVLTKFATGLPSFNTEGPFGITLASNGNVIAFDFASSTNYVFKDVDGQTPATALLLTPANAFANAYATPTAKPNTAPAFPTTQ